MSARPRCEEGVLTLALSDVDLLRQAAGQLQAEEFSSPCLAKAYALLLRRHGAGGGDQFGRTAWARWNPRKGMLAGQDSWPTPCRRPTPSEALRGLYICDQDRTSEATEQRCR